jgi:CCR4-NOT transcription complex subunit 9
MDQSVEAYVHQLINPATRENALLELSKKRENFPELAPYLWHSCGAIAALLQEIVSIYPLLSPPSLTAHASNRVCNALALLQCVASHNETRALFLQGKPVRPKGPLHNGNHRTSPLTFPLTSALQRTSHCSCTPSCKP